MHCGLEGARIEVEASDLIGNAKVVGGEGAALDSLSEPFEVVYGRVEVLLGDFWADFAEPRVDSLPEGYSPF